MDQADQRLAGLGLQRHGRVGDPDATLTADTEQWQQALFVNFAVILEAEALGDARTPELCALREQARQLGIGDLAIEQQRQMPQRLVLLALGVLAIVLGEPEDTPMAQDVLEVQRGQAIEFAVG